MSKPKLFEVQPDRKYLIVEKPNDSTPKELRAIGRAKRGGGFTELAGCPFDNTAKKYNHGLDKFCREFDGMSDDEVEKILKDRKKLVEYFQRRVETAGQSENLFLSNYKLELKHNTLIDTSNIDGYLRLFLACRSNKICPETEVGNVGKYNGAMYMIIDSAEKQDIGAVIIEMKFDVINWLTQTLKNDRETAIAYLKYDDILPLNQEIDDGLIKQAVDRKMNDYDTLERFTNTLKKVDKETVHLTVNVMKAIRKGQIRKESTGYYFDSVPLGKDVKGIVRTLKNPENVEVLESLFAK